MWQDGLVSLASQGGPGPSSHIKPTLPMPPPTSAKAKWKYSGQEAQFRTSQRPSKPRDAWQLQHARPKFARVAAHTQLGKLRLGECRLPSQSRTGKAAENLQFSKLGFCPLQHAVCPWTISVGNLAVTPQILALKHVCLFVSTHLASR